MKKTWIKLSSLPPSEFINRPIELDVRRVRKEYRCGFFEPIIDYYGRTYNLGDSYVNGLIVNNENRKLLFTSRFKNLKFRFLEPTRSEGGSRVKINKLKIMEAICQ